MTKKNVLLEVLKKEHNYSLDMTNGEESDYSEILLELIEEAENRPDCERCADTGENWTTQQDEKGRDIDIPIKCQCNV